MSGVASSKLFLPHQTFADHGACRMPVSSEALRQAYERIKCQIVYEEETLAAGGRFPISANSWWHGGVHLLGANWLFAPLPGRIVAARLAPPGEHALGYYGSRNFLLLEHRLPPAAAAEPPTFFTLLMHLSPWPLSAHVPVIDRFAWLKQDRRQVGLLRVKVDALHYRSVPSSDGNEPLGTLTTGDRLEPLPDDAHHETLAPESDWRYVRIEHTGETAFVSCDADYVEAAYESVVDEALLDQLRSGAVVCPEEGIEVEAGALLWRGGEYGPPDARMSLVHWEVFSPERLFAERGAEATDTSSSSEAEDAGTQRRFALVTAPTATTNLSETLPAGTIVEVTSAAGSCLGVRTAQMDADEQVYVREADRGNLRPSETGWTRPNAYVTEVRRCGPAHAHVGQTVTFEAQLKVSNATAAERKRIRWAIKKGDGQERQTLGAQGTRLQLELTEAMRGQTVRVFPYKSKVEEDQIVAQVAVARLPLPQWQAVEDPNDNYNYDATAVQDMVADFARDGADDTVLEREELWSFYESEKAEDRTKRVALRGYACKFVSEWGIPDLQAAVEKTWGPWFWEEWNLGDEVGPYLWWEEAVGAGVPIPDSPHVWHYNPIAVLQQLWHEGYGRPEPTFFVEREGEEVEVEYPSLLKPDGSIEDVIGEGEVVHVREEEDDEAEWLGKGYQYGPNYHIVGNGLADLDRDRRLYDVLIGEEITEGVPDLDEEEKRIWASLWNSEGGFAAQNSYDSAMYSFGPFQQTMGKPPIGGASSERGELQGALNYIKQENEALFERYFGQYGLDVTAVQPETGVDKGHFVLDGVTLTNKRQKWQLRAFKWAWRFRQAMEEQRCWLGTHVIDSTTAGLR